MGFESPKGESKAHSCEIMLAKSAVGLRVASEKGGEGLNLPLGKRKFGMILIQAGANGCRNAF